MKRGMILLAATVTFLLVVTSCQSDRTKDEPTGGGNIALIILYGGPSNDFQQKYGDLFEQRHPNISLQVINLYQFNITPGNLVEFEKIIDEQKPDVVQVDDYTLKYLISRNKLVNLDTYIKETKFDLQAIHPPVLQMLRNRGDGSLYGLTPFFPGEALYYNKNIFQTYGVDYPQPGITWEEYLDLIGRFPAKNDMSGLYIQGDPYYSIRSLGIRAGLNDLDAEGKRLVIDTDGWRNIWAKAVSAYRSHAIQVVPYSNDPQLQGVSQNDFYKSWLKNNAFLAGKAAMRVAGYDIAEQIRIIGKSELEDKPSFDWDMIPIPVNRQAPKAMLDNGLSHIYSIPATSAHTKAAWELIEHINGEETAKLLSGIEGSGMLPSRPSALPRMEDKNLSAFYASTEVYEPSEGLRNTPTEFYGQMAEIAAPEIQSAIDGKQTVEEALQHMQDQGQQLLDELWQKKGDAAE